MCLGLPGRIVEIAAGGAAATVDVAGVLREIDLSLLAGACEPGQYLLIHSGYALERMTAEQASAALRVFADAPSDVRPAVLNPRAG